MPPSDMLQVFKEIEFHIGQPAASLEAIAKNYSQLSTIDLSWCKMFSDSGIFALADHSHKLKYINLTKCIISDSVLSRLAAGCPI